MTIKVFNQIHTFVRLINGGGGYGPLVPPHVNKPLPSIVVTVVFQ